MADASAIGERYAAVRRSLNERGRRLFAAAEARTAGHGGISASARATGIARSTIGRGLKDLDEPGALSGLIRRPGSGRHALTVTDPTLLEDLRQLLEPATMGDPMRPLLWVSKSHAKLAAALCAMGHQIAKSSIPKLLGLLKYRRQVNRKTLEGSRNPDRNAQFEHINAAAIATQAVGQPVISIDTKRNQLGTIRMAAVTIGRKAVRTRSTCMTSLIKSWAKSSLWRLRPRRRRWLREPRYRPRHGTVLGQFNPALAGSDGP